MSKRKAALSIALVELFKRRRFIDDLVVISNHLKMYSVCNAISLPALIVKNAHFKMQDFYENWIDKYLITDFFALFRMTPLTFNKLLHEIGPLEAKKDKKNYGKPIPLEKGLLMTIWYLAKGDTLINISDKFGVSISTTHENCFKHIKLLMELMPKYIKWSNKKECEYISQQFLDSSGGYPNVIGAIDGSHINCKVPQNQHDSYANRKMNHSIIIQGICTVTKLLTNVCIGFPGSVHDARVLKESTIFRNIEEHGMERYFFNEFHLIGDSAYPCLEWLMTPYRDTGRLSRQQKKHNTTLSKGRVAIENTFALLKGRWRILKYVDVYNIEKVIYIISACCVLHNYCLLNNDGFDLNEEAILDQPDQDIFEGGISSGVAKRNFICDSL